MERKTKQTHRQTECKLKKGFFLRDRERESLFHNERSAVSLFYLYFFFIVKGKRVVWAWRERTLWLPSYNITCFLYFFQSISPKRRFFISFLSWASCVWVFFFFFLLLADRLLCELVYSRESPIASIIKRIIYYSARIPPSRDWHAAFFFLFCRRRC